MTDINDKKNISGGVFAGSKEEFQVRSATSKIGFDFDYADPPPGAYIGVDDQLQVTTFANTAGYSLTINLRILLPSGIILPMVLSTQPTSNRAAFTQRFQLAEGYLLSLTATASAGVSLQQYLYAVVGIARAPFGTQSQYDVLVSDYVGALNPISYPQSALRRSTDGAGVVVSFNQAAPAAGADLVVTVPTGARWRLQTFRATLTAAVAVSNRLVHIVTDDGANILMDSPSNFTQVASIVNTYSAFDSAPYLNVPFDLTTLLPLASNQMLRQGSRIRTLTTGIQAADQWSAAQIGVIEWQDQI